MTVRDKINPTSIRDSKILHNIIIYLGYTVEGFVLSVGKTALGCTPFGVALIAVSKRKGYLFSTLGALIGYMMGGINTYSARYLAAVVIACLGAFAAEVFELGISPSFPMTIAFLADFATGIVINLHLGAETKQYAIVLGEAILAMGGSYFLYKGLNTSLYRLKLRALPISDLVCIVICLAIFALNFSALHFGIIYPAQIVAVPIILFSLRYAGERWGVILALTLGFSLSIGNRDMLFLVGGMGFSVLVASLFSTISSLNIGIAFMCSMVFFSIASGDDVGLSIFTNSIIGTLIFVLMPEVVTKRISAFWDNGKDIAPDGTLRQNLVLKLRFASSAMATISESVDQVREKINAISRTENERCRDQISEDEYIQREIVLEKTNQIRMVASDQFFSISDMLDDLALEFDEAEIFDANAAGKIRRFLGDYEMFPANISAIEDKFGRMRIEILFSGFVTGLDNPKLRHGISKICSRYFEDGRITNFKNETMLSFYEKPNYRLDIGYAQHSAEGKLCGDTVKTIEDNKGHSILIISDGMGKGSRAALDGAMGAGLLSRLINAGFGFDSALKVVNSALLVKSNDESLATLDIANIDLFTGKCEIFKAGAPASYIIKNNSMTKCELTSMPAGILRGIEFAKRTAVIGVDDSIILMSDGITDLGDEWLRGCISAIVDQPSQQIADYILNSALEYCHQEAPDDMSVIFARLERN
ncbi:MAG: SpoIIE family protein phosphatase [Eubacterium sp.]